MAHTNRNTIPANQQAYLYQNWYTPGVGFDVNGYYAFSDNGTMWTPAYEDLVNAHLTWMHAENTRLGHDVPPAPRFVRFAALVIGLVTPFMALAGLAVLA